MHGDTGRRIVTTEDIDQVVRHEPFETVENVRATLSTVVGILLRKNLNIPCPKSRALQTQKSLECSYLLENNPLSRVLNETIQMLGDSTSLQL